METRKYKYLNSTYIAIAVTLIVLLALSSASVTPRGNTCSTPLPNIENCNEHDNDTRHKLYLLAMGPFPNCTPGFSPGWDVGRKLLSGVGEAVKDINLREDILEDYKLCVIATDSGCGIVSKTTISIVRDVFETGEQVVGIIGPACSGTALMLAPINSKAGYSIINITPSATSPLLENPEYNNTFATVGTSLVYIGSFKELMRLNNWNQVATLHDEERVFFKTTFSRFRNEIRDQLKFSASIYDGEELKIFPLDSLRASSSRVVFVFAGSGTAARLMCIAFHKNMLFPTYQWIFHDRSPGNFLQDIAVTMDRVKYNCTKEQMGKAVNGIILNRYKIRQDDKFTIPLINRTYAEYEKEFPEDKIDWTNSYYDAVWAMAFALHNAMYESGVNLTTYKYGQLNNTEIIRDHLLQVRFEGATGPISFDNVTRATKSVINLFQLNHLGDTRNLGSCRDQTCNLTGGDFVSDIFDTQLVRVHLGVSVIIMLITLILFVLTVFLQLAFIVWYHHRSIKATSPNISHLIFSGCYLFSLSVMVFALQESFVYPSDVYPTLYAVYCNTITWCMILGYSLIFGTVLTKAWRVYRLFKHFRNQSPGIFLTDNALIVFVIVFLILDICILVTWNLYDPWILQQNHVDTFVVDRIPTLLVQSQCHCNHLTVWVGVVGAYKGAIAIALVAFSILNRRIRRRNFKHTRKVNILVYSLTAVIAVGIPLYFLLGHISIYIGFIVLCFILNLTVMMCCLMLFIPPVLPVIKVKMGLQQDASLKSEFKRKLSTMSTISIFSTSSEDDFLD